MIKKEKTVEKNPVKARVQRPNAKNVILIALWALFAFSFIFALYKNFTAIDRHTVHEVKVVEEKITDTSQIESFVQSFAEVYHAWSQDSETNRERETALQGYLTDDLLRLNTNIITGRSETASTVTGFKVWEINKMDDHTYTVLYTVNQKISRTYEEMEVSYIEETELVEGKDSTGKTSLSNQVVQKEIETPALKTEEQYTEDCYIVTVYLDQAGNMILIQNPTINSTPKKADYSPVLPTNTGSVSVDISNEITAFLEKFFTLYPGADEIELSYYVKDSALPIINRDYEFVELVSNVYEKQGEAVRANIVVKYYDEIIGVNQLSQFDLLLEKNENWFIVPRKAD